MACATSLEMLRAWIVLAALAIGTIPPDTESIVSERVKKLTRESSWKPVASIPISFRTHHPQGMVKIGDQFIVSSVEIHVPTRRLTHIVDGYDRDAGEGVGHLFKIDVAGRLLADLRLGDAVLSNGHAHALSDQT